MSVLSIWAVFSLSEPELKDKASLWSCHAPPLWAPPAAATVHQNKTNAQSWAAEVWSTWTEDHGIHWYMDTRIYIHILLLHFRCWVEPSLCAFSVFFSYHVEGLLVFYWLALFLTNSSSDQTLKPLKGDVNNIYHLVTWHAHPLKCCCRWRLHSSMAVRPVCQFPTSQFDNNCWKCRHNSDPFWPHAPTYTGFVHIF